MVAQTKVTYITPQEYLEMERDAETKSEYDDGVIVAMAGSSPEHSAITFNLSVKLGVQLDGLPCRGFTSDLRVRVPVCNKYYYPDVTIVCNRPEFELLAGVRSLLNPTLLIEVLSNSTAATDRGEKWRCYRTLESLTTYVLIAQDRPEVEVYTRMEDGDWRLHTVIGLDASVPLRTFGCELRMADVYAGVTFPAEIDPDSPVPEE
jgi:Uma2 family endonuclease